MASIGSISTTARAASCPGDLDARQVGARGTGHRFRALRSNRELAGVSDSELRLLLSYVDEVVVPAGIRLAIEGRPCRQLLIVAEGRLRAASSDGACQTLRAGDASGWSEMWERSPNRASVVAESEARLLVMGHAQFRAIKAVAPLPADL